jgi:hypothetical protein
MRGVSMRGIGMRRRICMVLIEGVGFSNALSYGEDIEEQKGE